MDESSEKEMKLQMLLLSLKDLLSEYADRSGCGEIGRTIVSGYDTKLLQDVVETALTNFASPSDKKEEEEEEEAVVASSKPLLPMDESVEKKEMKLLSLEESDLRSEYAVPGCGEVGRIIVSGYDTRLPQDVVETALRNHFSSCGRITDVCVTINPFEAQELVDISYVYFVGEGAVDKALDLNGTDVGGWTVNIEPYPFRDDANRIVWLTVKGFDTSLSDIDIELALTKHFSSCGEIDNVCVYEDGSAELFVNGEDAAEKVPKLNGSIMEDHHKLVLKHVCYPHIKTVHERPLVFC